jgi:hypothetical protein
MITGSVQGRVYIERRKGSAQVCATVAVLPAGTSNVAKADTAEFEAVTQKVHLTTCKL